MRIKKAWFGVLVLAMAFGLVAAAACVGIVIGVVTLTGIGKFGMITPLGGAAFILAWSLFAWSAFRTAA